MMMNSGGMSANRLGDRTSSELCQFNCPPVSSQSQQQDSSLGEILRELEQPSRGNVKRQLDLNIVLSNYIKHRLADRDDD